MRRHFAAIALVSLCATSCASPTAEDLHRQYMNASIRHDLGTLRSMTAEDAVWQLGPRLLEGRDAVLGPNSYDAGMETELEYRNVIARGDTVEFELVERSDELRAVGMDEVRHYPRFIFADGQVVKKEPWKMSPDPREASRLRVPLRQWIRESHPEALDELLDSDGQFVFSVESGALLRELANEWRHQSELGIDQPPN